MSHLPDGNIFVIDVLARLHRDYPDAPYYPSYEALKNRIYSGLIRSEKLGGRRSVPITEIPKIARMFDLDLHPADQIADAAD